VTYVSPPLELPLTPIPGTADDAPLVSYQQYVRITGDKRAKREDVVETLAEAIVLVCQECNRTLAYGQYLEDKYLYDDGKVYPSAVPIDPTKPILSGEKIYDPTVDDNPGSVIQGWGVWVGWFTPLPFMSVFEGVLPPQTNITYWGGFIQSTLPPRLRRLICRISYKLMHPNNMTGIPGGVDAVSVNGVSFSGKGLTAFDWKDQGIEEELRSYTRPDVEAWQS
jgi:hypothetical protein